MATVASKASSKSGSVPNMDICDLLDEGEKQLFEKVVTAVSLRAGGFAFFEGDSDSCVFNVASGALSLSKLLPNGRRQVIDFVFAGDLLGPAIAGAYGYSAQALTAASLRRFDRKAFTTFAAQHPKLERKFLAIASMELVRAQEHLLVLGRKSATERLATLLVQLTKRIGSHENDGWRVALPMTRADLADYLGLTTETVSRTFGYLNSRGVIGTFGVRSFHVPSVSILASYSGDD